MSQISKSKLWREEDILRALRAVEEEGVSVRQAAKMKNVPRITLADRVKGRVTRHQGPHHSAGVPERGWRRHPPLHYLWEWFPGGGGLHHRSTPRDLIWQESLGVHRLRTVPALVPGPLHKTCREGAPPASDLRWTQEPPGPGGDQHSQKGRCRAPVPATTFLPCPATARRGIFFLPKGRFC